MLLRLSCNFRSLRSLMTLLIGLQVFTGCTTEWHLGDLASNASTLSIISQPISQTVPAEQSATFTVAASDTATAAYQWYKDGQTISGATSASYTISKAPLAISGSQFTVEVSDQFNALTSHAASLTVNPLPAELAFVPIQSHTFGDPPFSVFVTSPSNGAINYSILSGPATISGSVVTLTGRGNVVVVAAQMANGDYASATASANFMVASDVDVSPITPANQTMGPGQQTFTATAAGGLNNAIRWTATAGSFAGNVWTSPNAAGQYTITATSADDPSKSVSTAITISPPIVTKQPMSPSACTNGTETLSVGAIYDRSYQWNRNGVPLNGATEPSYLISEADASLDAGTYTVSVSNPAGGVTSDPAVVTVGSYITSNPASLSVAATETAAFSVNVTGRSPFTYQWFRIAAGSTSGTQISRADSNFYAASNVNIANNGDEFYAVVTDSCGATLTSTPAILSVSSNNAPPTIITQPVGQSVPMGETATFSVVASGTPTLSYQWYQIPIGSDVGTLIPGATSPNYTLPLTATTIQNDQDAYYVTVTNSFGEASSLHGVLTVGNGITITKQPSSVYIESGDAASFSVSAVSALPLTYQWYQAAPGTAVFTPIPAATSSTYTLPSADVSVSGSTYYVIVSNGVTLSVQSNTAALFVGPLSGINSCENWDLIGDATYVGNCGYQLTQSTVFQSGEIVWPTLISTANIQLSFTIATSEASPVPADGFTVVLGDPSLGATVTSQGLNGEGIGARGIPGVVIAFDDYGNPPNPAIGWPQDPQVPYLGVGRSENDLWENPYFNVNTTIPALADLNGLTISHDYVVSIVQGFMTVSMDGVEVFSGDVDMPPVAYLYATASTGMYWERTVISNISAVASPPSPR
jgi:Immunoglobulin I-set domain